MVSAVGCWLVSGIGCWVLSGGGYWDGWVLCWALGVGKVRIRVFELGAVSVGVGRGCMLDVDV